MYFFSFVCVVVVDDDDDEVFVNFCTVLCFMLKINSMKLYAHLLSFNVYQLGLVQILKGLDLTIKYLVRTYATVGSEKPECLVLVFCCCCFLLLLVE